MRRAGRALEVLSLLDTEKNPHQDDDGDLIGVGYTNGYTRLSNGNRLSVFEPDRQTCCSH